jgi:hypothetical protein
MRPVLAAAAATKPEVLRRVADPDRTTVTPAGTVEEKS